MHLHLLVRTPCVSCWSLGRAWFLWIETWCSPSCCLDLFLLYLGRLCIILLPLLGSRIICPPFHFALDWPDPSLVSWALGLPGAAFIPTLPPRHLYVPALLPLPLSLQVCIE
jgi:hypothetical protein